MFWRVEVECAKYEVRNLRLTTIIFNRITCKFSGKDVNGIGFSSPNEFYMGKITFTELA